MLRHNFDATEYAKLIKDDFVTKWNKEIKGLHNNKDVLTDLEALFDYNATLAVHKMLLFRIVSSIEHLNEQKVSITTNKMASIIHRIVNDDLLQSNSKIAIIRDLSVLELSLLIAIKHHNDIYDRDPFNFEIIYTRLHKFQNAGEFAMGAIDRAVVLKAFDVLKVILSKFQNKKKFRLMFFFHFIHSTWVLSFRLAIAPKNCVNIKCIVYKF